MSDETPTSQPTPGRSAAKAPIGERVRKKPRRKKKRKATKRPTVPANPHDRAEASLAYLLEYMDGERARRHVGLRPKLNTLASGLRRAITQERQRSAK